MKPRAFNSTLPAPEKPMKRTARLRAKISALKAKGGARFPKRRNEAYRDWIRALPCCLTGCITRVRVECAHVKSRGAGGDDVGNCVPLCRTHHDHQHLIGIKSFQKFHRVDLASVAATLALKYDELAA